MYLVVAIPRVLTAILVAYARGTVLYLVVMPTGGTLSSILIALYSIYLT